MESALIEPEKITDKQELISRLRMVISNHYLHFVLKKGAFYLVVIFAALTLAFLIPRMMPGDPVSRMIRPSPINPLQAEEFEAIKRIILSYFGLAKPLHEQYIDFWVHLLNFDLGYSFSYWPKPVIEILMPRLMFTMVLVVPVLFISFFVGNWIGSLAAFRKGKGRLSDLLYQISILSQSAPFYWIALILYVILVADLGIFPVYGWLPPEMIPGFRLEVFIQALRYYTLPFLVLLITFSGGWATGMRAMILYEMDAEYMLYAKHLGFIERTLRMYAQRNAILPQLTGLNLRFGDLIGATVVIEAIFGWPGLGNLALQAVLMQDFPLLIGTTIVTLVVVVFGNFLVDITYGFIDPRIRTGHSG
ncbi:MAG: ABC transporter permease [Candidatus Hermodarchaeota archaeon]